MIRQQDPGVAPHAVLLDHLGQRRDEVGAVLVIPDNGLTGIAPGGDMVHAAGKGQA